MSFFSLYTGDAQYGHPHCAKSADGSGVSISGHQHLCWQSLPGLTGPLAFPSLEDVSSSVLLLLYLLHLLAAGCHDSELRPAAQPGGVSEDWVEERYPFLQGW